LAVAFDRFCVAGESGFDDDELGDVDKFTCTQFQQPTESSHAVAVPQQRFLSTGDSLILKMTTPPNQSPEPTPIAISVPHSRLTVCAARLSFGR
jgi:hypothetical protein